MIAGKRRIMGLLAAVALGCFAQQGFAAEAAAPPSAGPDWSAGGQTEWIETPSGRVKTRIYPSTRLSARPVLVIYVHGDAPRAHVEQYFIAQIVARRSENVVAAGFLRPGYRDPTGESSAGRQGYAIGDNYTPEVVDALHTAIRRLAAKVHAASVILVGHSGGGAIVANLMGRHPGDAQAALLLACGCDPNEFMQRWARDHPDFPRVSPNPSLLPLGLAPRVSRKARVRLVIGSADTVAGAAPTRAYAQALRRRGVDVEEITLPGVDHDGILLSPDAYRPLAGLIRLAGGSFEPPDHLP